MMASGLLRVRWMKRGESPKCGGPKCGGPKCGGPKLIGPFGSSFVDGEEPGRRSGRCFADVVCAEVVDRDVIGTNVVRVDVLPLLAVMA